MMLALSLVGCADIRPPLSWDATVLDPSGGGGGSTPADSADEETGIGEPPDSGDPVEEALQTDSSSGSQPTAMAPAVNATSAQLLLVDRSGAMGLTFEAYSWASYAVSLVAIDMDGDGRRGRPRRPCVR